MPAEQAIVYDFDKLVAQYPGIFKGLAAYVDDIRQYGTLKQAIAEAQKRLEVAKNEHENFKSTLADKHAVLEAEYRAKEQQLKDAKIVQDNQFVERDIEAKNAAGWVIRNAHDEADKILTEAKVAAGAVKQRVDAARVEANTLESDIATKHQVLADLEAAITAKQTELDRIERARQALVAKIAS